MRRVPPLFAIVLIVMWLLLNTTVALGHLLLGTVLSVLLLLAAFRLRPLQPKLRRGWLLVRLFFVVLIDIVHSNIGVARVVLGLVRDREIRSGFLPIPLELRDPHGLAVLAMIITSTPGTIWVDLSEDQGVLTLHVLDLIDEAAWIHRIKERYERPLLEVFQ